MILNLNDPQKFQKIERFRFPDGQPHLRLDVPVVSVEPVTIRTRITNSESLMELLMVVDILRDRHPANLLNLEISYLMGGRMDRRIDGNQPFTLKVVTDLLNAVGFNRITLHDPHSDVAPALLNAQVTDNRWFVKTAIHQFQEDIGFADIALVAPDAGASKKVEWLSHQYTAPFVQCLKHRDPATGELSGFKVAGGREELEGRHVLIIDDICDGGGTFAGVTAELRKHGVKEVGLAVTHGIFSKGYNFGVDHIYTTNSYQDFDERFLPNPVIEEDVPVKVWDIFTLDQVAGFLNAVTTS